MVSLKILIKIKEYRLPLNRPNFSQRLLTSQVLIKIFKKKVVFPKKVLDIALILVLFDNLADATVAPILVEATKD
jgi:hypothetical protein